MLLSLLIAFVIFYNEEPKPEYEPYINTASIVITAKPPTKPTSHKGIRPVFAIKKAPIVLILIKEIT